MPTPITLEGAEKLRAELSERKKRRPVISQAIAEARAHGDLKENAEYHAAREEQSLNEAKIRNVESMLAGAQIIDIRKIPESGRVIFGSTVEIKDLGKDELITYKIVGEHEADPADGAVSISSPFVRALIGKSKGEVVRANTPSGTRELEIRQVRHL